MTSANKATHRRKPFPVHILVFLAPAFIVYTLFMIYPLLDSLRLSLYAPDVSRQEVFVGLDNYERLVTDELWQPRVEGAIKNNLVFFAIHMLVQNPIGLMLAALLSSQFIRGRAIYRTLIFTPTVLSVVLVGFIWRMILSPLWGISTDFLDVFGLAEYDRPWLGLEGTALPALSLISVWQWVGIPMMLFLAALISIPDELIEAARVDGATAWSVFWQIRFRLILPTVGIVGVLTFVGNFNAFDLIYTTQKATAGPNYSTDILGTFFYRTFFGVQLQPGNPTMGATVAGVMFLIILAGVLLYMFGWQRRMLQIEL
ncbi:MAG: sugar ABC transporter permease [Chloroflexi bacterium]|nr:sugar ABC transporter permease [Chloroflexota bacterium]